MAENDEDWKKFLESTEEDPEEVETEGNPEDEPTEDDPKDPKNDPDSPDGADEDDDPEEDPDEGDDPDEDDPTDEGYKPRLKQFFDKEGKLDAKKIEDAYVASGKQAVELKKQLDDASGQYDQLIDAIKKAGPEVAEKLFGKEGAKKLAQQVQGGGNPPAGGSMAGDNPLLQHLEAQMVNSQKKDYDAFIEANPEAVTDPEKAKKIGEFLKLHSEVYRQENKGEIPTMKDSLEAAYRYYGWDLAKEKAEAIATAAKKSAATRQTPQGKRKATKKEVTKGEEFFAKKLGVTLRKD